MYTLHTSQRVHRRRKRETLCSNRKYERLCSMGNHLRSHSSSIENPYALKEAINKLESALDEILGLFQGERDTLAKDGSFSKGKEA